MAVTFVGVRHHSPACARLVRRTIAELRPRHVLVEGPADFSDRIGELLLGHTPPVAIFSYHRDEARTHAAWTPMCDYSPEWVAINDGDAAGARVRFVDLPSWHPALADRTNRYSDAERRYATVMRRLCEKFAVDDGDTLWDHLIEIGPDEGIAARLDSYFDLLRGEAEPGGADRAREAYMARWVRAAWSDAGDAPVVVVTGGFHTPALRALVTGPEPGWPPVPAPDEGSVGGSFLVPYSFRRMDAFTGYQAGMPSPEYYRTLWEEGPRRAADALVETVARRLRGRRHPVSTADLVAARALGEGLSLMRGHPVPARTDVLDGLVSALVTDDLSAPPPWTGRPAPHDAVTHPVIAEMVGALGGDRVGTLHPDTPAPPLLHDTVATLERLDLVRAGTRRLRLTDPGDRERSRALHRLRVLGVPGAERAAGPSTGTDPVREEVWELTGAGDRTSALVEAGAYGATLPDAVTARLDERFGTGLADLAALAEVLFDAALCGTAGPSARAGAVLRARIGGSSDLPGLGAVLATVLGLWRHDTVLGTAGSALYGQVIEVCTTRILWVLEGVRGGPGPAEPARLAAVAAVRDALRHAAEPLGLDRTTAREVALRVASGDAAPPDLRGAAFGLARVLAGGPETGPDLDLDRAVRGAATADTLGDWLAGLFALSRDDVPLATLDSLVTGLTDEAFAVALPALRQAFAYFPPRERAALADGLLALRGDTGAVGGRALLRAPADPLAVATARSVEERVDRALERAGLLDVPDARPGTEPEGNR